MGIDRSPPFRCAVAAGHVAGRRAGAGGRVGRLRRRVIVNVDVHGARAALRAWARARGSFTNISSLTATVGPATPAGRRGRPGGRQSLGRARDARLRAGRPASSRACPAPRDPLRRARGAGSRPTGGSGRTRPPGRRPRPRRGRPRSTRPTAPFPARDGRHHRRACGARRPAVILGHSGACPARWPAAVAGSMCRHLSGVRKKC